jgi:hypothetical protein
MNSEETEGLSDCASHFRIVRANSSLAAIEKGFAELASYSSATFDTPSNAQLMTQDSRLKKSHSASPEAVEKRIQALLDRMIARAQKQADAALEHAREIETTDYHGRQM